MGVGARLYGGWPPVCAPGTWVAERVPLGMGGSWEAQVVITQPGAEPVAVTFAIELEGPE